DDRTARARTGMRMLLAGLCEGRRNHHKNKGEARGIRSRQQLPARSAVPAELGATRTKEPRFPSLAVAAGIGLRVRAVAGVAAEARLCGVLRGARVVVAIDAARSRLMRRVVATRGRTAGIVPAARDGGGSGETHDDERILEQHFVLLLEWRRTGAASCRPGMHQ